MKMDWKASSERMQVNLNELFAEIDLQPGEDLRAFPGLVGQVCEELTDHATRTEGYLEEDRYPVMVQVTQTYVLWLEGESSEQAARRLNEDSEWYEQIEGEQPVDHSFEAEAPESWDRYHVYPQRIGPARGCQTCQSPQPWDDPPGTWVHHTSSCPVEIERQKQWNR